MNSSQRNLLIACAVVLFHGAALWALQTGLAHRTHEVFIPVEILSELIAPPLPSSPAPVMQAEPVTKPIQQLAPPKPRRAPDKKTPAASSSAKPRQEVSRPVERMPEPLAPPATAQPQVPVQEAAPRATPPTEAAQAQPAAVPQSVELPSSNADYLHNPPPVYPAISKRLGEQGSVMVRVLIGADGRPLKAELKRSSGFGRLDRAALEYVMNCRYTPGKVNGEPQDMWYDAPVRFVLE